MQEELLFEGVLCLLCGWEALWGGMYVCGVQEPVLVGRQHRGDEGREASVFGDRA